MRKNVREQVEAILDTFPETRNSDIDLMIQVWKVYYKDLIKVTKTGDAGIYLQDLHKLPSPDIIRRSRQKFNEEGLYLPTTLEVALARKISEDKWRIALGYGPKQ